MKNTISIYQLMMPSDRGDGNFGSDVGDGNDGGGDGIDGGDGSDGGDGGTPQTRVYASTVCNRGFTMTTSIPSAHSPLSVITNATQLSFLHTPHPPR